MPLATVWIPSYNYGRFLPDAIESVLAQTHRELELIVWDDGSTDDSFEIAERYAARDDRVRVLHHPDRENRGIAATILAAFQGARGAYLTSLAADDTIAPDGLERRVAALEAHPAATFAYGLIELLEEDGNPTGTLVGTSPSLLEQIYVSRDPLEALLVHNYIPGHGVLMRADACRDAGGIDVRLLYSDWELWMRLLALGPYVFVDAPAVAGHRVHGDSMSHSAPAHVELARRLDVFRSADEDAGPNGIGRLREPRIAAFVALQRAWYAYASGHVDEARAALDRAVTADPSLVSDADYLLWWIGPHQEPGTAEWLPQLVARTAGSAATVAQTGAARGHFASWAVVELGRLAGPDLEERLAWGVLANEVAARTGPSNLTILPALLARAVRRPGLLRDRWFLKSILSTLGAWNAVAALRSRSA